MGTGCLENQSCDLECWKFQQHCRGGRLSSVTNDQSVSSSRPKYWTLHKNPSTVGLRLVNTWKCGEWHQERAWPLCAPSHTLPVLLFYLAAPELYPFIRSLVSNCFPEFCEQLYQVHHTKRGSWESPVYSWSVRSTTVRAKTNCELQRWDCLQVSVSESRSVLSDSLQPHGLYS